MEKEIEFDDEQKDVIKIDKGYNLVLAPPGCGKTAILAERIRYAHQNGVEYKDMMCLTFTNRASKGMKERIEKVSGTEVPQDLFVGNIHRYCSQFLYEEKVVNQNAAIIDEYDTLDILGEIKHVSKKIDQLEWDKKESLMQISRLQHHLQQSRLNHPANIWLYRSDDEWLVKLSEKITDLFDLVDENDELKSITDAIVNYSNNNSEDFIGLENQDVLSYIYQRWGIQFDLNNQKESGCVSIDKENYNTLMLLFGAIKYEKYKVEHDLLDFDDLLIYTYEELKNNPEKHHKYKWIQIDEVQDLNELQFAIVDLATDNDSVVVYLGDEQQAIFSFMGTKLETLQMLKNRCEGKIYFLHKNYRSPKYLLDVFNTYAIENLKIDGDMLPRADNEDETQHPCDLYCAFLNDNYQASCKIAKLAEKYQNEGGTVAVLVPTNKDADEISNEFIEKGIEHFKVSGNDVFSGKELQLITAHLNIIQNELGLMSWAKLMYHSGIVTNYSLARQYVHEMKDLALVPTDLFASDMSSYLANFMKTFENKEIVLFDTETTGLDIFHDDIVQIAAIKIRKGIKVEGSEKVIYLASDRPLPPEIAGETNPMIEEMKRQKIAGTIVSPLVGLSEFMDYCQGAVLVAHNIKYDYNILKYNLQRYLPEIDLSSYCPDYFDTLKLSKILDPKLKVYKLARLLEVLHLEGNNSHNAIDDVKATVNLLDYCYKKGGEIIQKQNAFLAKSEVRDVAKKLVDKYKPLYQASCNRLYEQVENEDPILVDEMQYAYDYFLSLKVIEKTDKWNHIKRYYSKDLIDANRYPTLLEQLNTYITDINTTKEADLCAGDSMTEKFFISTVHKAKGLEFDNVIVTDCILDVYPYYQNISKDKFGFNYVITDQIRFDEDARKLYVAISRAKKRLCLVWYGHKIFWSKKYGECYSFKTYLSPFIRPIKKYLASKGNNV